MTEEFDYYYARSVLSKKKGGRVNRICWSCGHRWDGWARERCPKCGKKFISNRTEKKVT